MSDIFLSYNREDQARAKLFAEGFERQGLTVWWDVGLRTGEAYDQVTEKAMREAKAVVVLWSKRSVESRWVRAEATLADRNKTLLPCMIEACERPIMFELTQTAELSHWHGAADDRAWLAFLADLQRLVAKDAAPAPVSPAPAPAQAAVRPNQSGGAPSLAVLPFVNRSGLAEDEVFADGMVEDVIGALSHGFNVRVLASAATAHLRQGGFVDLAAIGRQLAVRYLLEGNVRRTGDRLRVTTQVIEASTSSVLWAGSFERPLSELAALQEDLVVEVAATLEVKVQALELQRLLKKPDDLTAWEAMARAYAFQRQADPMSLMRAIEEAQRSVNIAPDYAIAHAALAQTSGVLYLIASPDDPATVQRIRGHVDLALKLDSDDVLVLGNCSQALNYLGSPEEALVHATRAIHKAPNLGPLQFGLGITYCLLNRPAEALRSFDDADRLMPAWAFLFFLKSWRTTALIRAGRWEEAEQSADAALALNPAFDGALAMKAVACRRSQRQSEARAVFAPVTQRGFPLEQFLTYNRRVYANSPMQDEILDAIRALWTEITGDAQRAL